MSDGGYFPWKVQKVWSRGPAADYKGIRDPLPKPPAGMVWHQDRETREWRLVPAEAADQPTSMALHRRVVPEESALPPTQLTVDTVPEMAGIASNAAFIVNPGAATEDEWEMLSDKASSSTNSAGPMLFVTKAGSVRSVGSLDAATAAAAGGGSHASATLSIPYKIQRTHSNSTIDSCENSNSTLGGGSMMGPAGKGVLGVDYVEHIVLPTDTIQGICLAYKVNTTRLRQANHFSGNSLLLAPKKLIIPISKKALRSGFIRVQDTDAKEYKVHAFLAECPDLSVTEAKAYLELADWVLKDAIQSAKEDNEWEHEMDSAALRSGEIRITMNKDKIGAKGFQYATRGAGLSNKEQPTRSVAVMPTTTTTQPPAAPTSSGQPQRSPSDQASKPVTYHAMPAIATKTVTAYDIYNGSAQQGHLGVELQPLSKPGWKQADI